MLEDFTKYLICSACKSDQIYWDEQLYNNDYVISGRIICENCGKTYKIQNSIPNMIEYPEKTGLDKQKWEIIQKEFEKRALMNGNVDGERENNLLPRFCIIYDIIS